MAASTRSASASAGTPMRTRSGAPNTAVGRTRMPCLRHPRGERLGIGRPRADEVRGRRPAVDPERREVGLEPVADARVLHHPPGDHVGVVERCPRRGERGRRHLERVLRGARDGLQGGIHDGVADPRPGEAPGLRERAQHDHLVPGVEQVEPRHPRRRVLVVGLVEEDQRVRRDGRDELLEPLHDHAAGRVVGRREHHHGGVASGGDERLEVVGAVGAGRHRHRDRTAPRGRPAERGKAGPRVDDRPAGAGREPDHQALQRVRSRAEQQRRGIDLEALRQRRAQPVAADRVGIAVQVGARSLERGQRPRRRAVGALVEVEAQHADGRVADGEHGRIPEPGVDVPKRIAHAVPPCGLSHGDRHRTKGFPASCRCAHAVSMSRTGPTPAPHRPGAARRAPGCGPRARSRAPRAGRRPARRSGTAPVSSLHTSTSVARAAAGAVRESVTTTTGAPASAKYPHVVEASPPFRTFRREGSACDRTGRHGALLHRVGVLRAVAGPLTARTL